MTSDITGEGKYDEGPGLIRPHYDQGQYYWQGNGYGNGVSEIEEVFSSEFKNGLHLGDVIRQEAGVSSVDFGGGDVIYVAVGKCEETSMDALLWTLDKAVNPSTMVYLVHVFPETRYVPTPLGKLPISQVNSDQKEKYMARERGKRREFLQKFLDICSTSQVRVDTILIESDMEAKAILDLIHILNVQKVVLGATKSNIRKMRAKRGSGVADQILQHAPEYCEIKIICEGKEMDEIKMESPNSTSSSPSPSPRGMHREPNPVQEDKNIRPRNSCGCFSRPKFMI